ncbi:TRAP transporter small permease [Halomonas sp. AOP35-4E-18]|uniref:TRAP transporter small permease n=1 Tax=Halomonas sp. AOP35-4E-18 TaxID=3457686 RepID=UPI004033F367
MRNFLEGLYRLSGGLAAFFLAAIGLSVLAQVVGRQLGYTVDATGFASFCLAASTFLGLGYSMRHGAHVRVTLVIDSLSPRLQRMLEAWVCLCSLVTLSWLTWKAAVFTWQGYVFDEVSSGLLAIPLWIPQSGMVIGFAVITVAVLDDLISVLMKREVSYHSVQASE